MATILRLRRGILALSLAVTMGSLTLPQEVSAATPKPAISQFTVTPTSLPSGGGTVQVTATVTNARSCLFLVRSYAASFGKSTKISDGTCQYTFSAPANTSATTMYVAVTLSASSPNPFGAEALEQGTISVAPNIASVTSTSTTSTTFPETSGNTIPVPAGPEDLLVAGSHIWVASCSANAVTEIDAATHQVIQVIDSPQYGFVCPKSLALVGSDIWVADFENNSITIISASTGALVQTLSGPGIVGPGDITVTDTDVWISTQENGLSEFSPSGSFLGGVHGGPINLSTSSIASTGNDIWVTSDQEYLMEYNAHTGVYLRRSQAWLEFATDVSYHGGILWVSADGRANPLVELSASTGARIRVVENAEPGTLLFNGRALFADYLYGNVNSVREYSPTGKLVKTLISSKSHHSFSTYQAMVLDGNDLWVTNYYVNSVVALPLN